MFSRFPTPILPIMFLAVFLLLNTTIFAESNLDVQCQDDNLAQSKENLSREDYRALLEQCKEYYEEKRAQIEKDIGKTEQEKKTLANTIYLLGNKIKNLDYQISQSNIMIKDLGSQIEDTQVSITQTEAKIENIKEKLGNILQLRYEEDQRSTIEILLAETTLSDFFDNLVALEMLNLKTQDLLKTIKGLKGDLETQKETMDSEKKDLEHLVIIQKLQKQDSARKKTEHENLLRFSEEEYQKYLTERRETEEKVIKIGNLLFELLEVPEGGIKVEDAVRIAKEISKQTGIRAAFSLAILWQETRIGKILGGCYLRNTKTGDGVYIKTGNIAPRTMKPTPREEWEKFSDVYLFTNTIIKELNEVGKIQSDWSQTPVSCCMVRDGEYFGWGGAMGPAQFIPNTWMLYKEKIEEKTGDAPANPWNVRDAFLANGLYLKDLGAGSQTYEKEIYAALRYFGCTSSWCRSNYGTPVMRVATCFQDYIEKGTMSAVCEESIF